MDNKDILILPIGKVVIVREKGQNSYFLLDENNNLIPLNNNQELYVKRVLTKENNSVYYSEIIQQLLQNNPNINNDQNSILPLCEWIESIIPEGFKANFHKNLSTLEVNLNLNNFQDAIDNVDEKVFDQVGGYDIVHNSLNLDKAGLREIYKISQKTKNPAEYFSKNVSVTVLHELLHMASTRCEKLIKKAYCGFDTYPNYDEYGKPIPSNRGLTEGMTELISMIGIPGSTELASGYYSEALIAKQLMQIIGENVMIESYFGALGTDRIKKALNDINSNLDSEMLLRRIEDNYMLRNSKHSHSILTNLQNDLLDCYEKKIISDINNGIIKDQNELNQKLSIYGSSIVTPQIMEARLKNPDQFIGLEDNIKRFQELSSRLNSMIIPQNLETQMAL